MRGPSSRARSVQPTPAGFRLYRVLLALYPPGFRQRRGAQMLRLAVDMHFTGSASGSRLGSVPFWISLFWDALVGLFAEWTSLFRGTSGPGLAGPKGERMSTLFSDLRFSLRQIARRPGYAVAVIVLMAVGIAGNAAMFRVVNGLFIRPLPFDRAEQLVDLNETAPQWDLEFVSIAYRDFDTWRAENDTFRAMTVFDEGGGNLVIEGEPRRVSFLEATHDIDEVLRLEPHLGRFYGPEEDRPDGPLVALLTYGTWRQDFGAEDDVVGEVVSLDGLPVEIVGVLPPEADFVADVEMWLPLRQSRDEWRGWSLNGIGRLAPGVTLEQARADLSAIHRGMTDEFPVNEITSPVLEPVRDRYLGDYRLGSTFLFVAVGLVLLVACANIAGLMSVRSMGRSGEFAVRSALGASRARIAQQVLTEGALLALLGAAAGVVLGVLASGALVRGLPSEFPRWVRFDLDFRFVLFTVAVTVGAALLFALLPALRASRFRGVALSSGRATGDRSRRHRVSWLVSGEVAIALTLLVIGGLSVLDVHRLGRVDPGFEPEGLVSWSVSLPDLRYEDDQAELAFAETYLRELEAIPGVESAAVASDLPLGGHWGTFFTARGAPPRQEDEANPVVLTRLVSPSYFETLGVRFVEGRPFDEGDGREGGPGSIIVNQRFVETHLAHLDEPLGARVTQGTRVGEDPEWLTVVGVTRDVKHYGVDEEMRPGVYLPFHQDPIGYLTVALAVTGDSEPVMEAAHSVTQRLDPELPLYGVRVMTDQLDEALWARRATSWFIGAFSTVALLLAVAGIYGVISYSVGQRTREIGIRMAMGADREAVLSQVLRQGMTLVLVGVALGIGVSLLLSEMVAGLLVGVRSTDPVVYVAVTVVLLAVAAVANYLPARRAASIEPMKVLQKD